MSWLKKLLPKLSGSSSKKDIPAGLWLQCQSCGVMLYKEELEEHLQVCSKCGHHHRISAKMRFQYLFDKAEWDELFENIQSKDVLRFKDTKRYKDRLVQARKKTGETEALKVAHGFIENQSLIMAAFEFDFIGGSMGVSVGERFVLAAEEALRLGVPFVCLTASGGARMQEGVYSLMQMPRTASAIARLSQAKLPYISVLLDPTSGGVAASLAMLGDVILAEPNALIGFTGPRVINQTVKQSLPAGFQRSEFLLEHGAIDAVVDRRELKSVLGDLISCLMARR
ncbi:MAG TPA: acetyl-CoA carboxylase, carboxyltransferase subunit beta [Gammaproteobacteria bacterium]|nr:acetyl-CoA carboxylase, carboxyltransferase subunit beta [Gammaproteobacteria bacterium]